MKLSVIIPCYNEAQDLAKKSAEVLGKLKTLPVETELILVNDGSKDGTKDVISQIEGIIPSG